MIDKKSLLNFLNRIFKNRFRAAISITLILIVGFVGWRTLGGNKQKLQYQTAKVEKGTIVDSVNASGKVLTANIIVVTTQASGVVEKVYVKDGDRVVAGQKIVEITLDQQGQQKNASAWSSYLSAKNSLESAKAAQYSLQSDMLSKWKTYMDLAQSSTYQNPDGSPKIEQRQLPQFYTALDDWLAAEAKYKNQQGAIEQAKASMNNAWLSYQLTSPVITTPASGSISNVGLVKGMVVGNQSGGLTSDQTSTSSQRVAVIQNEANPIISFNLTEIDVPKVKVGQKATITLDSLPDKTFTGKVVTVDRIGTTSNNVTSYPAIIQLDTTSPEILPNMAANASIIIETKSGVLLVPSAAIQSQTGQFFARILKNGREQQVPVEIGISSDTQTEVISGLSEGDEVITGTLTPQQGGSGSIFGGGGFGQGALRPGGFGVSQPRR